MFFWYLRTYDIITKVGYTNGCLLDYPYSKKHCKLIAIDLSKEKALNADRKAI